MTCIPATTSSEEVQIPAATDTGADDSSAEKTLLLKAFEMFTQASGSLETAYQRLQAHARQLSEELENKNRELERSLAEKAEVQRFLASILERLPCGVLALDAQGSVILCNPMAAQILEQPPTREAVTGKRRRRRCRVLRDYFAASVSKDGAGREVEMPFVRGGAMRILATSGTPLTGRAGETIGTLHIIRDVTQVKALEEQGKRGERLSAMGEMAVELAHEIRNPLGSIELFASLLQKELPLESDPARWAENIRIGSRSLNNIVSNMLHFANPLSPSFSDVDLHDVVGEILRFTDPIMRQREVLVRQSLESRSPVVCGDRELLKQMILNLVLNSMQAMPSKGSLVVATRDVAELPGGAVCEGIELRVQDTGVGIAPENLGRVFDPFFTTNRNGTGLGLSVVHQIVDRHSGFIKVESQINIGTTFTIVLPSALVVSGAA
jgi:signal transduction histidine kinase